MPRPVRLLAAAAVSTMLAGCATYLDRTDAIAFDHGEAVRANIVQHVIDPWPAHAQNTRLTTNGQRAVTAVRSYRCRPAGRDIAQSNGNGSSGGGSSGASNAFGASVTINASPAGATQTSGGGAAECQ